MIEKEATLEKDLLKEEKADQDHMIEKKEVHLH